MSDGFARFTDRNIIAMRVNTKIVDLSTKITDTDIVEPITIDSDEGRDILRHSTAHILAQAVQRLYPKVKLGIGPVIKDGFYYDFMTDEPFSTEDLPVIKKEMERIIKENQRFVRRELSLQDARQELQAEPLKCELISDFIASADSGEKELVSIYDNLNPKTGEIAWKDLCRGPHLPNTRIVQNGWALTTISAAYWKANEKNASMQRIYGTAWESKEALRIYQERIAEAEKRDHRKLGTALDLFSFPDEIGSGLAVFHPKGGIIRKVMEDYSRKKHEEAGYEFVYSPHITKGNLFSTSGHLQWYADGMFPPMVLDEEKDESGAVTKSGAEYYLKPMNCPFHNLIYRSTSRSYRELPLKMFEFGTVYRYEKSGTLHGLTRVRGLTQDDAHIYVTKDQLAFELTKTLDFVLDLLRDYGIDDFFLELSTRDPENEKFVGAEQLWEDATAVLEQVASASGIELVPDPGGAAFYGPKISVQMRDAIGRSWQISTIQLDFNLPERFDLSYVAADGSKQKPVMIHRALFGSLERFFAILTEHYAGAFPLWLAPEQVVAIPVAAEYEAYLSDIVDKLKKHSIRAKVDYSSDRMQKKIRTHTKQKVPVMLIAGEEDRAKATVSFRFRDGSQLNSIPVEDAIARIVLANEKHELVNTAWQD